MSSADGNPGRDQVPSAPQSVAKKLAEHDKVLGTMFGQVSRLSEQVAGIAEHLAASSAVSAVAPPPAPVPAPVSLVFELQPLSYPSDRSRVAYLIGLLSGPARAWGTALWENQSPACRTYQAFTEEMKRNFDHPVKVLPARTGRSVSSP
uniref:DUF4939 domain-containing protein n=1 Tax=Salarias fasciatus TaxID=181472 RepID=A0A672GYA4_SALFA